jgi:hypothetical protein
MRRGAFVAVALLLLGAATADAATTRLDRHGTIVLDEKRIFPIVLAKGPPAEGLAEVSEAGVNFVKVGPAHTWTDEAVAATIAENRAASAAGLHTWVNLSSLSAATTWSWEEARLRQVVRALEGDPSGSAIGMWKGVDEPWRFLVPPSWLQFAYCLLTGRGSRTWCAGRAPLDTDHLWVTVQAPRGGIPRLARYSRVTDIHGVNRYPLAIGQDDPDLRDVGAWTNRLAAATPNRAVWTTLQVCWTWSYDAFGNFALPTFAQERFMAYDAILNGARALAFYGAHNPKCWTVSDAARGWNWTFWDGVLEPLVRELHTLTPVLVRPGTTRWLRTSDPTTQAIVRRSAAGGVWVIAARSGEESEDVTLTGLPQWARQAEVHTEGRSVAVTDGALTDRFDRWGVHVYRLT